MPDYSNSKIYAIRSHKTPDIYIGSTCGPLSKRLYQHRHHYKAYNLGKRNYLSSFEIIKHPDNYIELIKEAKCSNKNELHKIEGGEIRLRDCVNKNVAGRTRKERYRDNPEKFLIRNRNFLNDNPMYMKNYYKKNKLKMKQSVLNKTDMRECVCGVTYNHGLSGSRKTHHSSAHHIKKINELRANSTE